MGVLKLKTGPILKFKTGPSFFFTVFPQFYSVFWAFLETQIVQQCVKIVFFAKFGGCQNEVFENKIAFLFFLFYVRKIETGKRKKRKWKRPQNPIKIGFFKVVIQKCEKAKNGFLAKKCLTLFVSGREKKAHFRAHYLFWPNFFGPKQRKPGKTIKIVVSAEIAQNQK